MPLIPRYYRAVLANKCHFSEDLRSRKRFQDHTPASNMNSAYQLKMSEVVLDCGLRQLDTRVPTVQTSIGQRSFAFYGPIVWNNLPSALRYSSLELNWGPIFKKILGKILSLA